MLGCAQIFGPVLAVATFSSEEEAIRIANNSEYGLGAAVVSNDKGQCQRVANALEAGIVWINCSQPTFVQAPWGGTKVSVHPAHGLRMDEPFVPCSVLLGDGLWSWCADS